MPDGVTHHALWRTGWIISGPASIYLISQNPVFGLGSLLGYGAGKYITPDWDIAGLTKDEGMIINDFKILGYVIVGYTTIYGIAFRRHHRSFWTHFPWISTFGRLIFLLWWVPILYWQKYIVLQDWHLWFILGFWFGLGISDSIHYTADKFVGDNFVSNIDLISSTEKRVKSNRKKKMDTMIYANKM